MSLTSDTAYFVAHCLLWNDHEHFPALRGDGLQLVSQSFLHELQAAISAYKASHKGPQVNDAFRTCMRLVYIAESRALLGAKFPKEETFGDFLLFAAAMPKMVQGIPPWFFPRARAARDRLTKVFVDHFHFSVRQAREDLVLPSTFSNDGVRMNAGETVIVDFRLMHQEPAMFNARGEMVEGDWEGGSIRWGCAAQEAVWPKVARGVPFRE